jgi:hypothetical protein
MKNYFKFNLSGNKLFPVWLLFIFLYIIPYSIVQKHVHGLNCLQAGEGMSEVL